VTTTTTYHAEADILTPVLVTPAMCADVEAFLPTDGGAAVGQSLHDKNAVAVSLAVDAEGALVAEDRALRLITNALTKVGVELLEIVDLRVVRWDLFEAEAETPNYPDLVSAAEAAVILDISRQRVHQLWHGNPGFPEPLYRLGGAGPLWVRAGIESFARRWERRPGRPPKAAARG
jgi:hypothetical protein